MAGYDLFPGMDEEYSFPPEVRAKLATQLSTSDDFKVLFDAKAPLASPLFTGVPKAPTPDVADASTQLATTEWTRNRGPNVATLEEMLTMQPLIREGTVVTVRQHARSGSPDHIFSQWAKQGDGLMRPVGEPLFATGAASLSSLNSGGVSLNNFLTGPGAGKAYITYMTRIRNTFGDAIAWVSGTRWNYWDAVDNRFNEAFVLQGDVGLDSGPGVTSLTLRGGQVTMNFSLYSGNPRGANGTFAFCSSDKWKPVDGGNVFTTGFGYDGNNFLSGVAMFATGILAPCGPRSDGGAGWNAIRGTLSWRLC